MDFEGVTWAGNIYQKFEAMCLEVEEVMYEDTIKYMEDQVQKVGVSVKAFYAEIMQDLLPTSCVDPGSVVAGDLPPKPYTQSGIDKKPKSSILEIHGELEKKESENEDVSDLTAEDSPLNVHNGANYLSPLFPRVLVENTHTDVCSPKSKKVGVYNRPIGITRISKNNHPPKIPRFMTSLSGDRSSLCACDMRINCLVASDNMNGTRSSEFFVRNNPGEVETEKTSSVAPVESFNSDQILLSDSVRQEKNDSKSTSPASEKTLSAESLREKTDDYEGKSSFHGLATESTDDPEFEVIETREVLEPRVESFAPVEKSKLEESCILVEGDMLPYVSQGTKRDKSYKKKIREALSSKLRSTRKKDPYIFQPKDLREKNDAGVVGVVIPALIMDCDKRKFPVHDSCESEWELL